MKPIKDWLNELPDGYRELALEDASKIMLDEEVASMSGAIVWMCGWLDSKGGGHFWHDVQMHYATGTPLPPLPKSE